MNEPTALVEGFCTPRFEPLRQVFTQLFESGQELGASLAVTVDGEFALDLWGGWADEGRTRRWERETIANVFSTTKTMIPLVALTLVERGLLDLDAPVARYWPEFAAAGKSGVLVRHILSHTSGVSGWEQRVTVEDLFEAHPAIRGGNRVRAEKSKTVVLLASSVCEFPSVCAVRS